tara:strand:+ start:6549 stop:8372 length:1824 start_codon:yes stop_codon:yes gene_type:complete
MNKIQYIVFVIALSFIIGESKKYRLTPTQNQKIRQARTLQNNGLNKQAKEIYYNLFIESPYLKEAFYALKKMLKNEDDIENLKKIYPLYLKENGNSITAKIDVIDIMIWINDDKWKQVVDEIINNKSTKEKHLKSISNVLLKNSKNNELKKYIDIIRKKRNEDFFSYELGTHHAINLSIEESINEFILHLDYNPQRYNIIRNKILAFPDIKNINDNIKSILNENKSNNAKLILSEIAFRDKNFIISYELLQKYSDNEAKLLEFVDSLIKNKEYELAQTVIDDIIDSNYSAKTIQSSIIKLAELYEIIIKKETHNLPISSKIYKNELLDSPFKRINNEEILLLENAITIYDSLIINNKDIKSTYNLAQIKYKILGDLDGSNKLFNNIILNTNTSNPFHSNSIIEIINIMISKGQLLKAKETLQKYRDVINPKELFAIKEIQILFYLNEWVVLNQKIDSFLKDDLKNINYYNDILKMKSYIAIFGNEKEQLNIYTKSLMKKFQNKRYESIKIISELSNNNKIEISSKMKYEHAQLLIKQNNIDEAITLLDKISEESAEIESAILLKAEIYDYILNNLSIAVDLYLYLLDTYPDSIYYDLIRLRLREITS